MDDYLFEFITPESPHYTDAVELRFQEFYAPYGLERDAAQDKYESVSRHLICLKNDILVGYVRLTIVNDEAVISQYVVERNERGQLKIAQKLIRCLLHVAMKENVKKITGEVKLKVAKAAIRFGFSVDDQIVYSKKTGLPHKRIELIVSQ